VCQPCHKLGQLPLHVRALEAGELTWSGRLSALNDRLAPNEAMTDYLRYLLKRFGQFALVVFIGVNLAYVITHATPIDPVEQSIAAVTSFGNTSPDAIADMRRSLQELYGLKGGRVDQFAP